MNTQDSARSADVRPSRVWLGKCVEQLLLGIIIGVSAGAVLEGSKAWQRNLAHERERAEQIAFFVRLKDQMGDVCAGKTKWWAADGFQTPDELRHFQMGAHARHLQRALAGRSTRLTFDEIYDAERVHAEIKAALDEGRHSLTQFRCNGLVNWLGDTKLFGL